MEQLHVKWVKNQRNYFWQLKKVLNYFKVTGIQKSMRNKIMHSSLKILQARNTIPVLLTRRLRRMIFPRSESHYRGDSALEVREACLQTCTASFLGGRGFFSTSPRTLPQEKGTQRGRDCLLQLGGTWSTEPPSGTRAFPVGCHHFLHHSKRSPLAPPPAPKENSECKTCSNCGMGQAALLMKGVKSCRQEANTSLTKLGLNYL